MAGAPACTAGKNGRSLSLSETNGAAAPFCLSLTRCRVRLQTGSCRCCRRRDDRRREGDAAEVNPHVALADAFACGASRNGRNRLNADLQLFQFIDRRTEPYTTMPSHSFCAASLANCASTSARRTEPPPSTSSTRPRPFSSSRSYSRPLSSKHFTVVI